MPDIYFEDFAPGAVTTFGPRSVTAEEIVSFARDYDAQPFHIGEEEARGTFAGRLIASGWHTFAIQMRMLFDAWLHRAAGMGSPGIDELRWLRPVLPGDVLSVRQTILDATASRSRPGMGIVRFRLEVMNGAGDVLMEQTNPVMFARRVAGTPAGDDGAEPPHPARTRAIARFEDLRARPGPGIATGYDEVEVGATEFLDEATFTAGDIISFAKRFDPQPFHVDEEAARRSHFGGLIASGVHTSALWMRGLVRRRSEAILAAKSEGRAVPRFGPSPGFKDLRWPKPVYAGDTIRYATTFVDKRVSASRPGWGLVFNHNTGWNQHGEQVFAFSGSGFIGR